MIRRTRHNPDQDGERSRHGMNKGPFAQPGRESPGPDSPGPESAQEEEFNPPPLELTSDEAGAIAQLEKERDEAVAARQRALADFANYQRRARENEARARQEGVISLLRALLPVIDHFDLAISQDPAKLTVEQLLGGVKIVRAEFDKVLESQGVARIEPVPGDEFDPRRHEAMMRQPSEGIAPNHIVATLQPGFAMGDVVLRPAKVAIAPEE